ncbi:Hint domain-containing protein [Pelagovum pacificum]|uniref:Hedgehog/Intein (Hint) domain-containing protein n=1 Tax=Pelagovum pacificum TaxID=2588711 RepID=A0A5C5GDV8_9RHOB|nr:Hint domain-containing protein [Pelagovum pacificum]QQA43993.1 Hint domain-containing protein [Pelagovum pacificum]TNY32878.1 hypothetical protein FHY64_06270 [Pelagovum pacificum]
MATTFNVFYLGNNFGSIDPTEGDSEAENASLLINRTYGSTSDPLYNRIQTLSPGSYSGGNSTSYDQNNSLSNDTFRINGGSLQTYDGTATYNATLTYSDGTTTTITAVIVQDTAGRTYLFPEVTANTDQARLTAKPITSVRLTGVESQMVSGTTADRQATSFVQPDGTVHGTGGDDTLLPGSVDAGSDTIDGADGNNDIIDAGAGNDLVRSGNGADLIYGGTGNDSLFGEAGNDVVYGGDGIDTLYGGTGDDRLYGDASSDTIYGDEGYDTLYGGAGADTLYGGLENDTLYGGDNADRLEGGAGNDTLHGDAGDDRLYGDSGIDTLYGGTGADSLYGGTESDTLYGGDNDDLLQGGTGADTLYGDAGNDTLSGEDGADALYGGLGDDTLLGGIGNDTLAGNAGSDSVSGGTGDDFIFGDDVEITFEDLIVNGSFEDFTGVTDTAYGGVATGSIIGWTSYDPNNTFDLHDDGKGNTYATDGTHTLDMGGSPNNLHVYQDIPGVMEGETYDLSFDAGDLDFTANNILEVYWNGELIDTIDAVDGGMQNYSYELIGGSGNGSNRLEFRETGVIDNHGTQIDNVQLIGPTWTTSTAGSADTLAGDAGEDSVFGGLGNDSITGGDGNDLLWGGAGDDRIDGGADNDRIDGGDGNDSLTGGSGNDSISGGLGADTIDGGTGDDLVYGGDGNDSLTGDSGADTLYGGAGDDVISGGTGADDLYGGDGNDTIRFAEADTVFGGDGDDLFILEDFLESLSGEIDIFGGEGGETNGDTLQLGKLADLSTLTINNSDDAAGGLSGFVLLDDGTVLNFSEIENIICFGAGTRVLTPRGARPVESLRIGDKVVTRDHGLQPIRWIGSRKVPGVDRFAPVRITPRAVPGLDRDLIVSPQHRMLFQGARAELLFGDSEVLVAATHLVDGHAVLREEQTWVTYFHLMFDEHEIIFAEGAPTESFHPGHIGLSGVTDAAREEMFSIFPELRAEPNRYGDTARRCLKRHEALILNA